MRHYLKLNVYEAALERIRFLFREFPNVVVNYSGGKDSTIVYNLCMIVAKEMDRLPLKVIFLDQEAEWQATINQVTEVMENPDVEPLWFQMPIKLFNATSTKEHWLYCWNPNDEENWMRPKVPYAITENTYGTDRFGDIWNAILKKDFKNEKTVFVAGVRCEESPGRTLGLTSALTYKDATWGKVESKTMEHYTMYPIYDWSYIDVWKAIHDNKWSYNAIYDAQYCHGVKVLDMRVSNLHHETAVQSLFYMQEVEPETYVKLTQRIDGIDMAGKMGKANYFVRELPFMFANWKEYRDFLLEKLIDNEDWKKGFKEIFERQEAWLAEPLGDKLFKVHVQSILTNDWEYVKLRNFEVSQPVFLIKKQLRGEDTY